MTQPVFEDIFEYVLKLEIIDTHEHYPVNEKLRERPTDILREYNDFYFPSDLRSAGYKNMDRLTDISLPLMERWRDVAPYWDICRATGYGRCLDHTVRLLYGLDGFNGDNLEELDQKFQAGLASGNHYDYVLRRKSNLKTGIREMILSDLYEDIDDRYVRGALRLDNFIYPKVGNDLISIENAAGIRICCLDDWLEACDAVLEEAFKSKLIVAMKTEIAYERSLRFDRATKAEAEEDFNNIFKANCYLYKTDQVYNLGKKFQDYMMHYLLRWANRRNLTFQFHTGIQEGNANVISNADPSLLSNLFMEYPDVDFDIFHIGYPYQNKLSALCKVFPNVFIDMCWAHIISPTASINALTEWLDSVPYNKISAFGGDFCFIDGVAGHQYMARENVSRALAVKVKEGLFDLDQAKKVARMLFYDNPFRIFKLEGKI
jgi:Predicted metal-dependent hydrolase of the TIM-barrel fold